MTLASVVPCSTKMPKRQHFSPHGNKTKCLQDMGLMGLLLAYAETVQHNAGIAKIMGLIPREGKIRYNFNSLYSSIWIKAKCINVHANELAHADHLLKI